MLDFLVEIYLFRSQEKSLSQKLKKASKNYPYPIKLRPSPSTNDTNKSNASKKKWKKPHEKSKKATSN